MEYKVKNKFKIRESCGGSYVILFYYEKKPHVDIDTELDGCKIEQWYEIPDKHEIIFRLLVEDDLNKIGDFVELKNPLG